MVLESNNGSSNDRYCFMRFCFFLLKKCNSFLSRKKIDPERMSGSSQTYLLNSSYNIDPSTMVTKRFKIMRFFY